MSASIDIKGLKVRLGATDVLNGVNLNLPAGSYGVLLGRSGSGKTTLLRAVAGIVDAEGAIKIGNDLVTSAGIRTAPKDRQLGFLFQSLALWPHMTVVGHLRYVLGSKLGREEAMRRIQSVLDPLGLASLKDRYPFELSGGEKQRLALARALVCSPRVLLLDEPTSSVDPTTAESIRRLLAQIRVQFGSTILHVTHDQDEALGLADHLYVMHEGRIEQGGSPQDLYQRPTTQRVAQFLGAGTLIPVTIRDPGRADSQLGGIAVNDHGIRGPALAHLRPHHLRIGAAQEGIPGEVLVSEYLGEGFLVQVKVADLLLTVGYHQRLAASERIHLSVVGTPWVVPTGSSE
jgi:iron(III) transport system ATP-binding protein